MRNFLAKRIETRRELIVHILIGFSPVGVFVPGLIFSVLKICEGSVIDTGIECIVPILGTYIGAVSTAMYVLTFIPLLGLISIIWLLLGVFIWLKILNYLCNTNPLLGKIIKIVGKVAIILLVSYALFSLYKEINIYSSSPYNKGQNTTQ